MIERGQAVAAADEGPRFTYEKRALLERLDAAGHPIKSEEKIYQVTLIAGIPCNRLVRVKGRELSEAELQREQAKEERFQQRFASVDGRQMAARKEALVTPELLSRYDFTVNERTVLSNRSTLVLSFKPKNGNLPARSIHDKLLNRLAGTVWIDEADADAARLDAHLVEPLSLGWFGWIGSLSRCELVLDRQRVAGSAWVNTRLRLLLQCRRLTTPLRVRITEESTRITRLD
jgi:hypothetical protein